MKIKRIQVKNIGPYVNENAFDFDVSDITKRMVLIGGKNGAGKTTLFNAIKYVSTAALHMALNPITQSTLPR